MSSDGMTVPFDGIKPMIDLLNESVVSTLSAFVADTSSAFVTHEPGPICLQKKQVHEP
ncbi:hypothetical protein E1B28_003742 [Marasmius oreades]|uniref:Uncharacterized protein n=1 Tax=Marasmius oreades TaxID=181124 RepID=A0A9P7UX68_9AGAR|nr:uncharacterized protein E1B28_003742 [Marasmius oreades]KAG7096295.1 hypothetical protein E1B28_003742 [Marasmius oreades]